MAIMINGEEKKLGLALSGGGFRAAAFHLGTFRKLEELKLLDKIDLLSCVSGGSIAGAFLCANWGDADVLDRLETYLRTRSIAVSSVLGGIFNPFESRLDKLAQSYDKDLFADATLDRLKNGPRIYLNATNLSTGNLFSFVAGGGKPSEMGDYELDFVEAPNQKISTAVAASSAFPPVFPPLKLPEEAYPNEETDYVTLSDGGIYDNMGINPLLRFERNPLDYAIVSDAGKPFANDETPVESGTRVLIESVDIMMEQIRGLQFSRLMLAHASGEGGKPLLYSIDSKEGQVVRGDAAIASNIGTNLKKLKSSQMKVLKRHAGGLCEARIRAYAPELLPN